MVHLMCSIDRALLLSHVNDYTEKMATFTVLAKISIHNIGLVETSSSKNIWQYYKSLESYAADLCTSAPGPNNQGQAPGQMMILKNAA